MSQPNSEPISPSLSPMLAWLIAVALGAPYDPLAPIHSEKVSTYLMDVRDESRDRTIPVKVFMREGALNEPVILFSHGLGGSREMGNYLGQHWASRGYVAVFLQHPGSDESVWRGKAVREVMPAMKEAANGVNFRLRIGDVKAVIDWLTKESSTRGSIFKGPLNLGKIGMSGHSFGALTTQAVSGESLGPANFTDPRIKAAIPMSPSLPEVGSPERAFQTVSIPWLLMTGTEDSARIGGQTPESRAKVFPALPRGDKYLLILNKGKHGAFTDRSIPGEGGNRNPNHHRLILAASTAFWDVYLKNDPQAKAWLKGNGIKGLAEKGDIWETK